jgi:hypothetical protein
MRVRTRGLLLLLGTAAAVLAWLGWFEIAPALGFPTIGPAAMLNRVFVPTSDPGVWVGWVLMGLLLVGVAALYLLTTGRGRVPPGPASGALVGFAAWAFAGLVVMVIIGHVSPPPPAPPAPPGPPLPTTPDPMHATFLMLHLGALAPLEALVAWLLFGAVLGATVGSADTKSDDEGAAQSEPSGWVAPAGGLLALLVALIVGAWVTSAESAAGQTSTKVHGRLLATGPANVLPSGSVFVSVIELPQAAGAKLGPHAHVPGVAYVLAGRETISFPGERPTELGAGQGGFMAALAIHSHENRRRAPAAVWAAGLLVIGLALSVVSIGRIASRRAAVAVLSGLLVLAGAVALWDPWANAWLFIGVRPEAARGGVMPLPNASRVYESPDLEGLSPGPYTESLRIITIPSGGQMTVDHEPGPETLLLLAGHAVIERDHDSPITLEASRATLAQQGAFVRISNPGGEPLSLLSFSVVGSGGSQ